MLDLSYIIQYTQRMNPQDFNMKGSSYVLCLEKNIFHCSYFAKYLLNGNVFLS